MGRSLRKHCQRWKRERAKYYRKHQTNSEAELWKHLRARGLCGHKFRRQVIMRGWIVDFYCAKARLIVELDGPQHDPVEDRFRDSVLSQFGFTTIRFKSRQVFDDPAGVLAEIEKHLDLSGSQRKPEPGRVGGKTAAPGHARLPRPLAG